MTNTRFDQTFWEQLWSKTLREDADKVARRPPNAHLMAEAADIPPGRALDAGCGHGADTLWLAAHGWQVTAVDFSPAALAQGRSMAEAAGADVAVRIDCASDRPGRALDIDNWLRTVAVTAVERRSIGRGGRRCRASTVEGDIVETCYDLVVACTDRWRPWCVGWPTASRREGRCCWWDIGRLIPPRALSPPRRSSRRCRLKRPSRRSTPRCGRWSRQKSVRVRSRAAASMP
jgi:SAM-dependent methyltransferase